MVASSSDKARFAVLIQHLRRGVLALAGSLIRRRNPPRRSPAVPLRRRPDRWPIAARTAPNRLRAPADRWSTLSKVGEHHHLTLADWTFQKQRGLVVQFRQHLRVLGRPPRERPDRSSRRPGRSRPLHHRMPRIDVGRRSGSARFRAPRSWPGRIGSPSTGTLDIATEAGPSTTSSDLPGFT